jgi:hypothetical protein
MRRKSGRATHAGYADTHLSRQARQFGQGTLSGANAGVGANPMKTATANGKIFRMKVPPITRRISRSGIRTSARNNCGAPGKFNRFRGDSSVLELSRLRRPSSSTPRSLPAVIPSMSAIFARRPAPTRLTPFSVFLDLLKCQSQMIGKLRLRQAASKTFHSDPTTNLHISFIRRLRAHPNAPRAVSNSHLPIIPAAQLFACPQRTWRYLPVGEAGSNP